MASTASVGFDQWQWRTGNTVNLKFRTVRFKFRSRNLCYWVVVTVKDRRSLLRNRGSLANLSFNFPVFGHWEFVRIQLFLKTWPRNFKVFEAWTRLAITLFAATEHWATANWDAEFLTLVRYSIGLWDLPAEQSNVTLRISTQLAQPELWM